MVAHHMSNNLISVLGHLASVCVRYLVLVLDVT